MTCALFVVYEGFVYLPPRVEVMLCPFCTQLKLQPVIIKKTRLTPIEPLS